MLSRDEKTDLVERSLRDPILRDPHALRVVSEGWAQTIAPDLRLDYANRVLFSVLDPADADERIASTIAAYRERGLPFQWVVSPSTRPLDLEQRLSAAGFVLAGVAAGMIGDTVTMHVEGRLGVEVEAVDARNVDDWVHVQAEGWNAPPEVARQMGLAARRRVEACDSRLVDLVFRVNDVPIASSSFDVYQGVAHYLNAVVLPQHRGAGIFRQMIAARGEMMAARGIRYASIHALRHSSAPILQHLGFEEACELRFYRYSRE